MLEELLVEVARPVALAEEALDGGLGRLGGGRLPAEGIEDLARAVDVPLDTLNDWIELDQKGLTPPVPDRPAVSVRVVERAEVTGFPQERVHAARVRQEAYVADYESEIAVAANMLDPEVRVMATGFLLEVCPRYIAGTEQVALDLRVHRTSCEMKRIDAALPAMGPLQAPRVSAFRWDASVTCVGDKYTIAAVQARKNGDDVEELVLFVRARGNVLK